MVINSGGSALDAITEAIKSLEVLLRHRILSSLILRNDNTQK